MKKIRSLVLTAVLGLLTLTASAQEKGSAGLMNKRTNTVSTLPPTTPVEKQQKAKLFSSYVAPLGTVGTTGRYQIVVVKVRGLDTPNIAGFLVYDSVNDEIIGAQTAGSPGLGTAIVNGGSYVAGSYLFGSKLKPNNESNSTAVNNGSYSGSKSEATARGGSSSSSAAGGSSNSNSTATGGNGNGGIGGNGGSGGAGGSGQHVPPGHINNPSGNH